MAYQCGAHTHSLRYAIAYFTAYPVIMNFHSRVIRHSSSQCFLCFVSGLFFVLCSFMPATLTPVHRCITPLHFTAILDVIWTHKRKMPATTIKRRNNTLLFSCNCVFGCFLWFHSSSSSSASYGIVVVLFSADSFLPSVSYDFGQTISVLLV